MARRDCNPLVSDPERLRRWNWDPERFECEEPLRPVSVAEIEAAKEPCEFDAARSPQEFLTRIIRGYFPPGLTADEDGEGFATLISRLMAEILGDVYKFNYLDQVDAQTADAQFLQYIAGNIGLQLENFLFNTQNEAAITDSWREQIRTAVFRFKRKGTLSGMEQAMHIINTGVRFDFLYEILTLGSDGMYRMALLPYSEIIKNLAAVPPVPDPCGPPGLAGFDPLDVSEFQAHVDDRATDCGDLGPNGTPGYSAYSLLPPAQVVDDIANVVTTLALLPIYARSEDGFCVTVPAASLARVPDLTACVVYASDGTLTETLTVFEANPPEGANALDPCDSAGDTAQICFTETISSALDLNFGATLRIPALSDGYLVKDIAGQFHRYNAVSDSFELIGNANALCEEGLTDANYAQTAQADIDLVFTRNSILFNADTNALELALKLISDTKPFHLIPNRHTVRFQLEDQVNIRECCEVEPTLEVFDVLWKRSCCRYYFEEDGQVRIADASNCDDTWDPVEELQAEDFVHGAASASGSLAFTPILGSVRVLIVESDGALRQVALDDGTGDVAASPLILGGSADTDFSDLTFDIEVDGLVGPGGAIRVLYKRALGVSGEPDRSFSRDGCDPCDEEINANICWEDCGVPTMDTGGECCEAVAWFADGECCKFLGSAKWGCDVGVLGEPHNCLEDCPNENEPHEYVPCGVLPVGLLESPTLFYDFGTSAVFIDPLGLAIDPGGVFIVEDTGGTFYTLGIDFTISGNAMTAISPGLLGAGSVALAYTNKRKFVNTVGGDPAPDVGQIDTLLWDPGTTTMFQQPDEVKRLHLAACKTPPAQKPFLCVP